jgi:acyl-coenzyme A thioesterase PaaI-like protein
MTQNSESRLSKSHLYTHLEMDRHSTGELTCEGVMPLGPDVMTPGGVRSALTALLLEGSFGGNLLARGWPVLSNMSYQVREGCEGVARARAVGELVRFGTKSAVARGRVEDADDPDRLLGYGTIGYRMIEPRVEYTSQEMKASLETAPREPSGERERPGILEAMGLRIDVAKGTCELDAVHPGLAGPEGRLHGGAHQLIHEAAVIAAATREAGTDRVRTGEFSIQFMAPALGGPFVARTRLVSAGSEDLLFGVELVDARDSDSPRSISTFRMVII